jgi:hypothetical protein
MKQRFTLLCLLLAIFGFRCKKKSPADNIESWLDQQFPGQFRIIDSNLKMLDVIAQFKGKKQALVADRNDPDVQFLLDWQKGDPSLGLQPEWVRNLHEIAKKNTQNSREFYELLEKAGFENFTTAVYGTDYTVQIFVEPSPENRQKWYEQSVLIGKTIDDEHCSSFLVEIMEPDAWGVKYRQLLRLEDIHTEIGWIKDHRLMSVELKQNGEWIKNASWEVHAESNRCAEFTDQALKQAKDWAAEKMPQKVYWGESMVFGFEMIKHPEAKGGQTQNHLQSPAIRYSFPYFLQPPTDTSEPDGHITGIFTVDSRQFGNIQQQKAE